MISRIRNYPKMALIFFLFLFPDFIKANEVEINSYSQINILEENSTKETLKISLLKEIPRTKVSPEEKKSLSNRNPFLPLGQNKNGKSGFIFSAIYLTGIASINENKVAFIKTPAGINTYQVGEIIGSEFKLLSIDEKNLTIQLSNDIDIYSIKLEEDEK